MKFLKKRYLLFIIVPLLLFLIISTVITYSNPLRKDVTIIRQKLLDLTPGGTSMEEVIKTIGDNQWEIEWIDSDYGYTLEVSEENDSEKIIGEKSIRIFIGEYTENLIVPVIVEAYYCFDEESELIDIRVTKDRDVL